MSCPGRRDDERSARPLGAPSGKLPAGNATSNTNRKVSIIMPGAIGGGGRPRDPSGEIGCGGHDGILIGIVAFDLLRFCVSLSLSLYPSSVPALSLSLSPPFLSLLIS